jgi:hypothetical protein
MTLTAGAATGIRISSLYSSQTKTEPCLWKFDIKPMIWVHFRLIPRNKF